MTMTAARRAFLPFLAGILFLLAPSMAAAEVRIDFFSRELGANNFPHAFVLLEGTLDDGTAIDTTYGFTAKALTPGLLLGSVGGKVVQETEAYVAKSNRHFSLVVTDAEYRAAMAVVDDWATRKQPSYNLNRANCIHFVGEIAEALGLEAEVPKKLAKKPRSFLLHVLEQNEAEIARRSAPALEAEPPFVP